MIFNLEKIEENNKYQISMKLRYISKFYKNYATAVFSIYNSENYSLICDSKGNIIKYNKYIINIINIFKLIKFMPTYYILLYIYIFRIKRINII